jgi:hypothetical protein
MTRLMTRNRMCGKSHILTADEFDRHHAIGKGRSSR